jgi:hypothetical protein
MYEVHLHKANPNLWCKPQKLCKYLYQITTGSNTVITTSQCRPFFFLWYAPFGIPRPLSLAIELSLWMVTKYQYNILLRLHQLNYLLLHKLKWCKPLKYYHQYIYIAGRFLTTTNLLKPGYYRPNNLICLRFLRSLFILDQYPAKKYVFDVIIQDSG